MGLNFPGLHPETMLKFAPESRWFDFFYFIRTSL